MRALVSRMLSRPDDAWGRPAPGKFTPIATVPCRAWSRTRKEVRDDGKQVIVEDIRAQVPSGSDVQTDDQLTITNRLNATLFDGPLAVQTVTRRGSSASNPGHLELMLTRHKQGPN